ncbi:MAG TPA: bifunctional methylenetetrahydrofolate dehydrogenase/methenyltetrahydrofolate cyclohydrolase FolD [Alphaproteobacteria bacterium]|nr:bifunctional methylenetetrahydrofolate dehydrogenase/methenyltetrahydrofolate cyclohydrolase FolD [Alphaproteobacteria bacterium]
MTATIIDGAAYAAGLRARIRDSALTFKAQTGRAPGLTVVLVGEDPASQVYVRNKGIAAKEAGFTGEELRLPATTPQADLIALLQRLNTDSSVDGILVQFPLPSHIAQEAVLDTIDPRKDVDGLTPTNAGLLASGREGLVSCTPQGALLLLLDQKVPLAGLDALVIGRSILVGKPMAQLLLAQSCTVTIAHSKTQQLPSLCRRADIVVAAIGKPHFVGGDWIKPGALVIDVGINRIEGPDGKPKLTGDVDFEAARAHARAITPVPKGVGPMTIACLLRNTMIAACRNAGLPPPQGL